MRGGSRGRARRRRMRRSDPESTTDLSMSAAIPPVWQARPVPTTVEVVKGAGRLPESWTREAGPRTRASSSGVERAGQVPGPTTSVMQGGRRGARPTPDRTAGRAGPRLVPRWEALLHRWTAPQAAWGVSRGPWQAGKVQWRRRLPVQPRLPREVRISPAGLIKLPTGLDLTAHRA